MAVAMRAAPPAVPAAAGAAQRRGAAGRGVRPVAKRQLGNFPQAFSHVPLINTAMHLSEAGPDPRYLRFENESEDQARRS
jgi:hypothetical protein